MRYQNGGEERKSRTGHELYLKMSRPVENNANGSQSGYDRDEIKRYGERRRVKTDGGIQSKGGMGVSHLWDEWMSVLADDGKISLSFVLFSGISHSPVVAKQPPN